MTNEEVKEQEKLNSEENQKEIQRKEDEEKQKKEDDGILSIQSIFRNLFNKGNKEVKVEKSKVAAAPKTFLQAVKRGWENDSFTKFEKMVKKSIAEAKEKKESKRVEAVIEPVVEPVVAQEEKKPNYSVSFEEVEEKKPNYSVSFDDFNEIKEKTKESTEPTKHRVNPNLTVENLFDPKVPITAEEVAPITIGHVDENNHIVTPVIEPVVEVEQTFTPTMEPIDNPQVTEEPVIENEVTIPSEEEIDKNITSQVIVEEKSKLAKLVELETKLENEIKRLHSTHEDGWMDEVISRTDELDQIKLAIEKEFKKEDETFDNKEVLEAKEEVKEEQIPSQRDKLGVFMIEKAEELQPVINKIEEEMEMDDKAYAEMTRKYIEKKNLDKNRLNAVKNEQQKNIDLANGHFSRGMVDERREEIQKDRFNQESDMEFDRIRKEVSIMEGYINQIVADMRKNGIDDRARAEIGKVQAKIEQYQSQLPESKTR